MDPRWLHGFSSFCDLRVIVGMRFVSRRARARSPMRMRYVALHERSGIATIASHHCPGGARWERTIGGASARTLARSKPGTHQPLCGTSPPTSTSQVIQTTQAACSRDSSGVRRRSRRGCCRRSQSVSRSVALCVCVQPPCF